MEYIDVEWLHQNAGDPVRLVSELDGSRHETRKLEFFLDGRVGYASQRCNSPGTELGEAVPFPALSEINQSPEFRGVTISSQDFERLWAANAPSGA